MSDGVKVFMSGKLADFGGYTYDRKHTGDPISIVQNSEDIGQGAIESLRAAAEKAGFNEAVIVVSDDVRTASSGSHNFRIRVLTAVRAQPKIY